MMSGHARVDRTTGRQKVGIWIWDDLANFPSFLCFGVGGQSYSNFLASTIVHCTAALTWGWPKHPACRTHTRNCHLYSHAL